MTKATVEKAPESGLTTAGTTNPEANPTTTGNRAFHCHPLTQATTVNTI